MKKIAILLLTVLMAASIAACGPKDTPTTTPNPETGSGTVTNPVDKKTINITTKFKDDDQTTMALEKVVKAINERSSGSLELKLFTGGILPTGKDAMEQVVAGGNVILVGGVSLLGDYVPDYNALTGPFLYDTFDQYLAMTETDLVKDLNKKIEEDHSVKVLSLDWFFGFRSMMANKAIKTPADMKGLNIRVPNNPIYTHTMKALGVNSVFMPYPDTHAAIQQGVIDGVEGSMKAYYETQQYENVKEYSLTNHLLEVSAVVLSTKVWDGLSKAQQTIISQEFEKGMEENLSETMKAEEEYTELLEAEGVNFYEIDSEVFLKAVESVYTKFPEWTPGIYERILEELDKIKSAQ